jgi:hypothetical protein
MKFLYRVVFVYSVQKCQRHGIGIYQRQVLFHSQKKLSRVVYKWQIKLIKDSVTLQKNSLNSLSEKCGIGKSTVGDIIKNKVI